jgi:Bacterial EndoU nuclease
VAINDPELGGDTNPKKQPDRRTQDLEGPADVQHAETRGRAEYYEALHAVDTRTTAAANRADLASSGTVTPTAWDSEGTVSHPERPPPDSVRVHPERVAHILDGDRWGGGHRHGTGRPEKTEFPSSWDDEKIIGHILDVARDPDSSPVFQANRRWRVHGQRDNVGITVIVEPDGRIWSAWPDADSPGVVKNPRERQ